MYQLDGPITYLQTLGMVIDEYGELSGMMITSRKPK
jgi:hypothetical protein